MNNFFLWKLGAIKNSVTYIVFSWGSRILTYSAPEYASLVSPCCFQSITETILHSGLNLEEMNTAF